MPPVDLAGQTIAITGAARGIGLATARACATAGMTVIIGDLDQEAAAEAASRIPGRATGLQVDVTDRASFDAFLTAAEQIAPLDILINNAGVLNGGPFADEPPATTETMVAVNIHGVITGSQLALQRFLPRRHGHLVNIASTGGLLALPNVAIYTATKFAVLGFTRSLRQELRGTGVTTTIICPGHVNTTMTTNFATLPGVRVQQPENIAAAILQALRRRTPEVVVPTEMRIAAALPALLPARAIDAMLRAGGAARLVS